MIELHFWPTPNAWKITIMLEETGLDYRLSQVNLSQGEQFGPAFLAISPNARMPAITDHDGPGGGPWSVFESGAILQYLGEKTGRFYPADRRQRSLVEQWLFWQCAGLGPMLGQAAHFGYMKETIPYAVERYGKEARRLYGVMDRRLAEASHLAGEYSIADMACWPWIRGYKSLGIDLAEFPAVRRWFKDVGAREAVVRGANIGKEDFARRQSAMKGSADSAAPAEGDLP
jgi:GST-like protein